MTGRRGFTLFEMLLVVAIVGILAALVLPRMTLGDPDALTCLNRYLSSARSMAMERGPLVIGPTEDGLAIMDIQGQTLKTDVELPSGDWRLQPEKMVVFRDGTITPGIIVLEGGRGKETFLVSVTARAYEAR